MEEQVWAIVEGRSLGLSHLLPSVRQWIDWKITGVLPRDGGTLDQDPEFMKDLREIVGLEHKFEAAGRQMEQARAEIMKKVGRS